MGNELCCEDAPLKEDVLQKLQKEADKKEPAKNEVHWR